MKRINILDKYISELIAAGEVVERPASVVKELMENSIDAGATKITVEIKNGGVSLIKVSDNGSGINKEDVKIAFLRHSTSKIHSASDLDAIKTLGFRGEALCSICAVSKVEVVTAEQENNLGVRYIIEGGEEKLFEEAGRARGTTFMVRDLFFNTPARMKFLKKDVSEANLVAGVVDKIAMSHPEVAITFLRDRKVTMSTQGDGELSSCIYSIYGKSIYENMLPVEYKFKGVSVNGFIGRPLAARPSRTMQNFFINHRFAKVKIAVAALEEAFKGSIMVGKHPVCALYINVPYEAIDVNVHPAKTEVKFINEKLIFEAVYYAVKSALMQDTKKKEISFEALNHEKTSEKNQIENVERNIKSNKNPFFEESKKIKLEINETQNKALLNDINTKEDKIENDIKGKNTELFLEEPKESYKDEVAFRPIFGDFLNNSYKSHNSALSLKLGDCGNYLESSTNFDDNTEKIAEYFKTNNNPKYEKEYFKEEGDKEERDKEENSKNEQQFLYEQCDIRKEGNLKAYLKNKNDKKEIGSLNSFGVKDAQNKKIIGEIFDCYIIVQENNKLVFIDKHAAHERILYNKLKESRKDVDSQILLEPIIISLDKESYSSLIENLALVKKAGYQIEDFGNGSVIVRGAPCYLAVSEVESSVIEIANYIMGNKMDISTEYLDWLYHNIACRAAIKAGKNSSKEEIKELVETLENMPEIMYCPHGRPVYIELKKKDIEKQFGRT